MNESRNDPQPRWTNVTFDVEVTSPGNRLYRNGRQQVEVTLKLLATDIDTKPVALSPDERSSACLIDFYSAAQVAPVPESGTVVTAWGTTTERNEYGFYPGGRTPVSDVSPSNHEFVVRYMQTVDDAPKKFRCQITRDDGIVFQSNGNASKEFVELIPERLPSAHAARSTSYPWNFQRVVGGSNEWDLKTVDYYYCSLTINGGSISLRTFDATPPSIFQWESSNPASDLFSFTGVGAPGSETAVYGVPARFNSLTHTRISEPRRGEGVVVLIRNQGIRQDSGQDTQRPPMNIVARDEFGTDHLLRVNFKSPSNRHELVLSER
jgi:hypothetical protein